MAEPINWKKLKCNKCEHKKKCKKQNISKGSTKCQENLNLIEKRVKPKDDTERNSIAILWAMYNQSKAGSSSHKEEME